MATEDHLSSHEGSFSAMGFDLTRFPDEVDEELICPICSAVLQDPVQAPTCEHAFCRACIGEWLSQQRTCPVDRQIVSAPQLEPVPRILRNLLGRLIIRCVNVGHGCAVLPRLDALSRHEEECEANPQRPTLCTDGCGLSLPADVLPNHNCIGALRDLINEQKQRLSDLETRVSNQASYIANQAIEIRGLKTMMESLPGHGHMASTSHESGLSPNMDTLDLEEANLVRDFFLSRPVDNELLEPLSPGDLDGQPNSARIAEWAASLARARVLHWGRLISTPDTVLQSVIRRALVDSGCNAVVAEELMSRSDERGWPPGLRSLEMRQLNRRNFARFLCRRLPGNQAVLLLSCENRGLPSHMSLNPPGIIMIFANGVESVTSI